MTFRERLTIDYPDHVQSYFEGGCCRCPEDYGYEPSGHRDICDKNILNVGTVKCLKTINEKLL